MEKDEYRRVTPIEETRGLVVNNEDKVVTSNERMSTSSIDFDPILQTEIKKLNQKDNSEFKDVVYNIDDNDEELSQMLLDDLKEDEIKEQVNLMSGYKKF